MAEFDLAEGCPSVFNRPRDRGDGTVFKNDLGPDRLLTRLRSVHHEPRYDIAPELEIQDVGLAR
jgi:hypothetical protein